MFPLAAAAEYTRSDKDTDFENALVQNAIQEENLAFPADWGTVKTQKVAITGISVISDQQLAWDLKFYSTDAHTDTSNIDLDRFVKTFKLNESDGVQEAGANQYYYDIDLSASPYIYIDEDNTSEYHVTLVNRSATAKIAGAGGEVVIIIHGIPIC